MVIWKKIPGYAYEVSDLGNVRNSVSLKILKPYTTQGKYASVQLWKNKKQRTFRIHRLVAELYIPNPSQKRYVNHINGNKWDNSIKNLEWTTQSEQNLHAYKIGKSVRNGGQRKIGQYDKEGNLINIYSSTKQAAQKTKVNRSGINYCCLGRYKTSGGYIWKYLDVNEENKEGEIWRPIWLWIGPKNEPDLKLQMTNSTVSNYGRVKNNKGVLLKQSKRGKYLRVYIEGKSISVHRLVAQAFIERKQNKLLVDHIDNNVLNNKVTNLRWVTPTENMNNKNSQTWCKKVAKYTLKDVFIKEYRSIKEAALENNTDASCITKCCKGKVKTSKGFIWKYSS